MRKNLENSTQSVYKPLVSVIINTHNNLHFLPETLATVYAQTYKNYEIILFDNASTENIRHLAQRYDARLRYFRSDKFLTLGEARNEALLVAQGELIDFLDSDDLFLPTKLEKQVPLFENPKVGLVYCNTIFFKEVKGEKFEKVLYDRPQAEGNLFGALLSNYNLSFETVIFRRSALAEERRHRFAEAFNICTDFDLFLRIVHDWETRYVDEVLAKWRIHENSWSAVKFHLTPLEKMMMIARILEYEPKLFILYPKEMKKYLAAIYNELSAFYWNEKFTIEAVISALHAFCLTLRPQTLLKTLLIPVFSYRQFLDFRFRFKDRFTKV